MMPSFRHLYIKRKIQGQRSEQSLSRVESDNAEDDEYEVVPTERAKALVGYLMTLKKDDPFSGNSVDASENNEGESKAN